MLRSWTERVRPQASLGLRFARREVCAVQTVGTRAGREVVWAGREALPADWLARVPGPALVETIGGLCAPARDRYVAVQVGLPDPLFVSRVFDLDVLPRSREARADLVAWRLKKEFHLSDDIECTSQALGRDGAKELLLGVAGPKAWLAAFRRVLKEAGVAVRTVDAALRYRFNAFHDRIVGEAGPGALIALDADAWGVCAWDEQARVRFLGSRWREDGGARGDQELAETAAEIERTIRGYVSRAPGRAVKRLYVTGEPGEGEALFARLRERTNGQCDYLALAGVSDGRRHSESPADPGALAVAWAP